RGSMMRSQTAFGRLDAAPQPNILLFPGPRQSDHSKHRVRALLQPLARSIRFWRAQALARQQLRSLSDLDDHVLRDIGLTRQALRCQPSNSLEAATLLSG